MKENKDYNKPVRNTKNLLLQYCLSCEGNHGVYFSVMSADGAETIKCSLPLAEHFYCQLLIVLLVIVKNIYYKLHSFFFFFAYVKSCCAVSRGRYCHRNSLEKQRGIFPLHSLCLECQTTVRQASKQACQVPRFLKNSCLYVVAAQFPLMACKSIQGWLKQQCAICLECLSTADGELIQRPTELQMLLNSVQKQWLHSRGRKAGKNNLAFELLLNAYKENQITNGKIPGGRSTKSA